MAIDGAYIRIWTDDYSHQDTINIINYVFPTPSQKKFAINPSASAYRRILLEFKNSSILYSPHGYDDIEGDFELVQRDGVKYLASPNGTHFLRAKELTPFNFERYSIRPSSKLAYSHTPPKVTVIIPVYGSLRNTYEIKREVEGFRSELQELGGRVLISVDGHSSRHQTRQHLNILEDIPAEVARVFSHEDNLGFIGNVNFLYQNTGSDEIVVLLTTDVKLQPKSISRVIAPLIEDEKIALCTPFAIGGENLEAPESKLRHWRQLDSIISNIEPTYPDAETNVGYMLAVDRRKYRSGILFDSFFNNGYGDDSDLYYRCVNLGYRGVVADNCCVLHEHGASFSHTDTRSSLRIENYRRFMERWSDAYIGRHQKAIAEIEKRKKVLGRISSALSLSALNSEIAFLLPTNDRRIGGVCAIFDLAESLCDRGVPTTVLCASTPYDESLCALKSVSLEDTTSRDATLSSISWLIATSHDTCDTTKKLARESGCNTGYFIQGPEFSFSEGDFLSSVVTGYAGFDALFTVSRFLSEIVSNHVDSPVHLIPYGPPKFKYFETGAKREEKSIAVQMNGNPNKGSSFVAGVIAALVREGYHFYSFGNEALRGVRKNFCTHLGFLSTAEKIRLFNRVEFYLDASNFEGLGLLLLESIQCGAIPLYRHNGGSADLLKKVGVGVEVGDYADIGNIREKLLAFRRSVDWEAERRRCQDAVKEHSLERAVLAMERWRNA